MLIITPEMTQKRLAENIRRRRLDMHLTQAGLAGRSGVALPTLRKFEQKGVISLEGFTKLLMVLGGLEKLIEATDVMKKEFSTIDEVLEHDLKPHRKRGRIK